MHFRRMDQGTDADYEVLKAGACAQLGCAAGPVAQGMLDRSRAADANYPIDRLQHSLHTATRALRDGADEELIVCALFHDVGESLGPMNHGEVVAAIRPFISDANYWMLFHHPLFQTYFYARHLGLDRTPACSSRTTRTTS